MITRMTVNGIPTDVKHLSLSMCVTLCFSHVFMYITNANLTDAKITITSNTPNNNYDVIYVHIRIDIDKLSIVVLN